MQNYTRPALPQAFLDLVNQVFEMEKKVKAISETSTLHRNLNKIKGILTDGGLFKNPGSAGVSYHDPTGEKYDDTRTDCVATIAGMGTEDLEIVEVIKPIIFITREQNGRIIRDIVQPALVVAQSKSM